MKRLAGWLLLLVLGVWGGAALAQDATATVNLDGNDDLGAFLVDANGMTLYIFTNDTPGVSTCVDACAENWPPLTVAEDQLPTLAAGISGVMSFISREDGSRHVTYNGWPLYLWVNDAAPGDATGQGVRDVWFVAQMPDVGLGGNADLGAFLVGSNGMTLYMFTNDTAGTSVCVDACAENWPPLIVESADALTTQPGLVGTFGTIERADGSLQVTFNDMPLYYWVNDAAPGDATGQGVRDVWYVIQPPLLSAAANEEFGEILTGPNGMTLYTFANDTAGTSACVDACAANWPPLTITADAEIVVMEGVTGEVGTIERADGSLQVTYKGAPLYYWVRDVAPGATTGHNVRDVWFVAVP